MEVKYYKCIKEYKCHSDEINIFINYIFYNNLNKSLQDYYHPRFTLGCIYHTTYFSDEYILDDLGTYHKLLDVMPYLEPYELVIDELSQNLINNKMLIKGDEIEIQPIKEYEDYTSYLVSASTLTKNGRRITVQACCSSIYDGLLICYRRLRTKNDNYCTFYSLIHNKVCPRIKTKKLK